MVFSSWIPEGTLAQWMLFISITSVFNTAQTYVTQARLTRRIYSGKPQEVSSLTARLFGTWTLTSAMIRGYAAYHLHSPPIYHLAMASYLIALGHFGSELLVYRTLKLDDLARFPFIVATLSLGWLWASYDAYLK
ncbi:MAG: putative ergosterol 28 [Piptocephalis tieghemiana]|nr:MAG: putative ergosterol 28 [Piptocephalis tieghemiana]